MMTLSYFLVYSIQVTVEVRAVRADPKSSAAGTVTVTCKLKVTQRK